MTTTLADEVLTLVHAFPDKGRKDGIRDLAKRIAELDSERSRLPEALGKVVGTQLKELKELRELAKEWRRGGPGAADYGTDVRRETKRSCADELTRALDALEAGR